MKYVLLLSLFASFVHAQTITIFAAANLKFFFLDVIEKYTQKYPKDRVEVIYNSSGVLYKKIVAGEKYDIFLSADMHYPQKLYEKSLSATKPEIYTQGTIILLIAAHKGLKEKGLQVLSDSSINEITIANKKSAPYGQAAIEALKNSKLYDKLERKIVYSNDASTIIGDVLWYANAGILPKSAAGFLPRGYNLEGENWVEINQKLYSPIMQGYTLSSSGVKSRAAKRFIEYLLHDGQKIFKENGYK